jgi:hypothetical protein
MGWEDKRNSENRNNVTNQPRGGYQSWWVHLLEGLMGIA